MQHRVVCLCLSMAINRTYTLFYFTWHAKGDIVNIVCHRRGHVVTAQVAHLCSLYLRSVCVCMCARMVTAGVWDEFRHLDRLALMNILITSSIARACRVSSRPLLEINMEEHSGAGPLWTGPIGCTIWLSEKQIRAFPWTGCSLPQYVTAQK